jgi:hypothetical protein
MGCGTRPSPRPSTWGRTGGRCSGSAATATFGRCSATAITGGAWAGTWPGGLRLPRMHRKAPKSRAEPQQTRPPTICRQSGKTAHHPEWPCVPTLKPTRKPTAERTIRRTPAVRMPRSYPARTAWVNLAEIRVIASKGPGGAGPAWGAFVSFQAGVGGALQRNAGMKRNSLKRNESQAGRYFTIPSLQYPRRDGRSHDRLTSQVVEAAGSPSRQPGGRARRGTSAMASPPAPEPWRAHFQSLQQEFREAARRHPPLFVEVIIGPLPERRSPAEYARLCQERVSQGKHVGGYMFGRRQGDPLDISLIVDKDTEPSEQDEAAVQYLNGLRSLAHSYLSEVPKGLLDKLLPSRSLPPPADAASSDPGEVGDDWLTVLFHLAWNHPSTVLRATQQVWLRRPIIRPGMNSPLHQNVFIPLIAEHLVEAQQFVRPFPHSVFSRLAHDVWRSSDAAVDVIFQLASATGGPAAVGGLGEMQGGVPTGPVRAVRVDKKKEARDKWIYEQCCKGTAHDKIAADLKKRAPKKGWRIVSSKQRIQQIGNEYADSHGLERPPSRRGL